MTARFLLALIVLSMYNHAGFAQRLEKLWSAPEGFQTPESALYNDDHEMIYVSNMGPVHDVKNGDGFLSLLNPEGEIENLYWVKGLNDPKGIALFGKNIYVADLNEVIVVNIESGKIEKKYAVQKAKFLNDVTATKNGKIFVSDMNDQRIYLVDREGVNSWKCDSTLINVNGLFASNGILYAGNNSIWEINIESLETKEIAANTSGIDGLIKIDDVTFIYSNWIGKIFMLKNGITIPLLDSSENNMNTADISYSPELNILFVPTFSGNTVDAYKIIWE